MWKQQAVSELAHRSGSGSEWLATLQEKEIFVESILQDIETLGASPGTVTYTSDYFPEMLDLAERLIKAGHVYADDTPMEQMRAVRPLANAFYFAILLHQMSNNISKIISILSLQGGNAEGTSPLPRARL